MSPDPAAPARLPRLSLVLGGAASGKSAYAERLVARSGRTPVYVATAQAFDDEMRAKIAAHRARRGTGWQDVEAPHALPEAVAALPAGAATLIDCATMWLSNLMLAEADLPAAGAALDAALRAAAGPIVIVSNEVGQGVVPDTPLGRRFRDAQGALNQSLAARADLVVAVMAGLPLALKGTLP